MSGETSPTPLVIQFVSLTDFVEEVRASGIDIVRVWSGVSDTGSGGQPGQAVYYLNVQATDPKLSAVLQAALFIGSFDTIFGKPFGSAAERRKAIVEQELPDAKDLLISYLEYELPKVSVRPGAIFTGLGGPKIQPAYWEPLSRIHNELAGVTNNA